MNNPFNAILLSACLPFATLTSAQADIIAQWNFNSVPADGSPSTGTNAPSLGSGTASLIGGATGGFSTGGTNDPAASSDDSGWQTSDYPAKEIGNKTGGVQFDVRTVGYSNIVVRWDQRVTSTASKYFRLQYSSNGNTFFDYSAPVTMQAAPSTQSYYEAQTNNLTSIAGVNNNSNFAFRIVSEFEQSALGSGANDYVTVSNSNYSPSANVRYDYVTILGTLIPGGNTPPYISSISNQTIRVTQSTSALSFTVLDAEDPAASLTTTKTSSNPNVIPTANIVLGGSGASRDVTVTAGPQAGSSTITIWVIDTGAKSNSTSFAVTVLPENIAPTISTIPATNTLMAFGTPPIPFTIGDPETPADTLTVSGASANPTLLPDENIVFGGSDSNRNVSLSPAAGHFGVAPITITVSDGTNTASSSFALMVTPTPDLLFLDSFSFPNGSLVTNSGFLWNSRSGTFGQCQVTNGQLQITADQSEDVAGILVGAPYRTGFGTVLYAAFKARFLTLPNSTPDYFAHFANGSTHRGRIYPFIPDGVPFGTFHLKIGNMTDSAEFPSDLTTNVSYTLVTRYDLDSATTKLWVNPADESDFNATATDSQGPIAISAYGFRQASGFDSTILIDDLRVGLSFSAVTNPLAEISIPIPLHFRRDGNTIVLNWSDPFFALQSAPSVMGIFTNVPGAVSPYTNSLTGAASFFRLKTN